MREYDFILAGGGMAGLSLAVALAEGPIEDRSILIIDPEERGDNEQTWCYWTREGDPIEAAVSHSWKRLRFASSSWTRVIDLGAYRYSMVRGDDFYREMLDRLDAHPTVEFERAHVLEIVDGDDAAEVVTDMGTVRGTWVFDSRFDAAQYSHRSGPYQYLKQHFAGWMIETADPIFDPETPTLFDFRTPGHGDMRFVYVLPFSRCRALVEYTLFSAELLPDEEYARSIEAYIADVLGAGEYRVIGRERGVIPMTDEPVERREGARTLAIGTRGGLVKPSTGYAFLRTQLDTRRIVDSLLREGHPFDLPHPSRRARLLDTLLLQVISRRGDLSERVFAGLFRRNPIERLLRFLDEEASLIQTLAVMTTVPILPFLAALWRTIVPKKGTVA